MMKAVMISIQPQWVEKIAKGTKTIEVRKTRPKIDTPFKCYIYETNWKDNSYWSYRHKGKLGKVIGHFVCDRIDDFSQWGFDYPALLRHINLHAGTNHDYKFLDDYLKGQKKGYAWHISDLVIYEQPKELSEFKTFCKSYYEGDNCDDCKYFIDCRGYEYDESDCACNGMKPIERPPQSWCYVEEKE